MGIYSAWRGNGEGYGYLFLTPKKPMLLCSLMLQMKAGELLVRWSPLLWI